MKKHVILLLSVFVLLLSGCTPATEAGDQTSSADNAGSSNDGGKKEIVLFMEHMSNEFTINLSSAVEAAVKERGYEYKLYDAEKDAAKQQNQIEQVLTIGTDAIIVEPVSGDGVIAAAKKAKEKGIPVVFVNQRPSDMAATDVYIGADNVKTGSFVMKEAAKDLNGKGAIAILLGPMGSEAQVNRSKGFTNVLEENPDIEVVFEQAADWETAPALSLVENWLNSGKKFDAVVSQNDGMAIGAAKAISDANLTDKIKVYGVDATEEGVNAVKEGTMTATIGQGTKEQGKLAGYAAADLLEGKDVEAETIVDNDVVTQDNVE